MHFMLISKSKYIFVYKALLIFIKNRSDNKLENYPVFLEILIISGNEMFLTHN